MGRHRQDSLARTGRSRITVTCCCMCQTLPAVPWITSVPWPGRSHAALLHLGTGISIAAMALAL
eukprot:9737549-Alexandrium_andersonii.AAC.1